MPRWYLKKARVAMTQPLPEIIRSLSVSAFPAVKAIRREIDRRGIRCIVCLGIGDPCRDLSARLQLAFVHSLAEQASISEIQFFDPVCCAACRAALATMDFAVLANDSEGRFTIDRTTLFFMPHCPRFLYHNLLAFNWNSAQLAELLIVGNSFRQYSEKCRLFLQQKRSAVEDLFDAGMIDDDNLDFRGNDAFNGLSVISANRNRIAKADSLFFEDRPVYMHANPGSCDK
jgi:hypothetical protein